MCPEDKDQLPVQTDSRFVEGENGTVIDVAKRLVWLKKDTWQMTDKWMNWVQIRDYAEELNKQNFAGYSNWRMPSSVEAKSLYNKGLSNKDHIRFSIRGSVFSAGPTMSGIKSRLYASVTGGESQSLTMCTVFPGVLHGWFEKLNEQ